MAGWLGLGLMVAGITRAVKGSLLRRAVFLAVAGAAAVVLAALLSRLVPKEEGPTNNLARLLARVPRPIWFAPQASFSLG